MALSAIKDKGKPHELGLQISPSGAAVSAKPRKPEKTCSRLQILHKTKIHFFKKNQKPSTAKLKVMKSNNIGEPEASPRPHSFSQLGLHFDALHFKKKKIELGF